MNFRRAVGALLLDAPRLVWALRPSRSGIRRPWLSMRNREESLAWSPDGEGVRCLWKWTSNLHIAEVFPRTGSWLLARALRDWPIRFAAGPLLSGDRPDVSFVIGHRGEERLPHLRATLASIAAQEGVVVECIVVEQEAEARAPQVLPPWVRWVHDAVPQGTPYNRARAFNRGAEAAGGDLLILHDNDLLVPAHYAREAVRRANSGHEFANLKRFIFYLDEASSERIEEHHILPVRMGVEHVMENAEGGGTIVVARAGFDAIGGLDESFIGWGGEDNEFWDRALMRRVWRYGYLPLIHLCHEPQPEKQTQSSGSARYSDLSRIPPARRIAALRAADVARRTET